MGCEEKKYTEKEVVEREREAAQWAFGEAERALRGAGQKRGADWLLDDGNLDWGLAANDNYPLPKVKRLREAVLDGRRYRWSPSIDAFEVRCKDDWDWTPNSDANGRADFILRHLAALAALQANPYEEVDADD